MVWRWLEVKPSCDCCGSCCRCLQRARPDATWQLTLRLWLLTHLSLPWYATKTMRQRVSLDAARILGLQTGESRRTDCPCMVVAKDRIERWRKSLARSTRTVAAAHTMEADECLLDESVTVQIKLRQRRGESRRVVNEGKLLAVEVERVSLKHMPAHETR